MTGVLTFDANQIAALIAETRKAKKFRLTFDEQYDPDYYKDGVITYLDGWPDARGVDPSMLTAKLWLVKNGGVYLKGNQVISGRKKGMVCFAKGFSPDDEGFREKSKMVLGPEDCCIPLSLADFDVPIAAAAIQIKIKVSARTLTVYGA